MRDAHLHLRHVRDLLRTLDPADAYNGVNCSSLSYLSFYTQRDKGEISSLCLHIRFCVSIIPPTSHCHFQVLSVKEADELLKMSLMTRGLQSTFCPALRTVPLLHCIPSETTERWDPLFGHAGCDSNHEIKPVFSYDETM